MNRLHAWPFELGPAEVFSVVYRVCALAVFL